MEVQATNTLSATYTSMAGYAALGDSYSSGEGNPPFTGGACDRSEQAYPVLFQKRLPYTFYFEACSGATVSQLPEQADLVPEAARGTVKLVTLTIGGNDLHFADVIEQCVFDHVLKHTSCSNGVTASDPKVAAWVFDGRLTLQRQLPGVLRILRGTFPQAQIFVLGYPQIFPNVFLGEEANFDCGHLRVLSEPTPVGPFAGRDVHWLYTEIRFLNLTLRLLTTQTRLGKTSNSDAKFVDPAQYAPSFVGHDACSTGSWFTDIYWGGNEQYSLHPDAQGQQALADVLGSYFGHS